MKHKHDLILKLSNTDNWPRFENPELLEELNDLADLSFKKGTTEGYLAAILIYHQLCEEFVKILIKSATFFTQLQVLPLEFKEKELKGKMFGELLRILETLPLDNETRQFITKCRELNELRVQMVHKLTTKSTIEISKQCQKLQSLFNVIFNSFESIYDNYRVTFKDLKKDIEEYED